MKQKIEFTDRYGGNCPHWLVGCHGPCEAMGVYPSFHDEFLEKKPGQIYPVETNGDFYAWRNAHLDRGEHECDGWHFLKCPDCEGAGRVRWWVSVGRVPRWIWNGLKFTFAGYPSMGAVDTWEDKWMRFKAAFDLVKP